MDLTHYSVGAVPIDACRNHDHKVEKYQFFSLRFFQFLFIIVYKSIQTDELDILECSLAGEIKRL
jgi:hypothetical protein